MDLDEEETGDNNGGRAWWRYVEGPIFEVKLFVRNFIIRINFQRAGLSLDAFARG